MSKNDFNFPNDYFYLSESLNSMAKVLKKAFAPLVEMQSQQSLEAFNLLSASLKQLSLPLIDICSTNQLSESMKTFSAHLASIMKEAFFSSPDYDFSKFLSGITIHDDYIELSNEASEFASDILETQEADETHIEESKSLTKLSVKEFFIGIFIPVILTIITIIQNSYYHKIDELEAQKHQMEAQEYEAQQLKLMEQQNETLEKIYGSINEVLETAGVCSESLISDSELPDNANHSDVELHTTGKFLGEADDSDTK